MIAIGGSSVARVDCSCRLVVSIGRVDWSGAIATGRARRVQNPFGGVTASKVRAEIPPGNRLKPVAGRPKISPLLPAAVCAAASRRAGRLRFEFH